MALVSARRLRHVVAAVGASLVLAAAMAASASAAGYRLSGGGALFPGGFGVHGAVWVDPFIMDNLNARFGGEYWQAGYWRYIGADVSGLYQMEMARYAPDLATRLSAFRPYVGGGVSIGRWAWSPYSWTSGDLYGVGGAQYDLGNNLWAWGEIRLHVFRFASGDWGVWGVGGSTVSTVVGVGFNL